MSDSNGTSESEQLQQTDRLFDLVLQAVHHYHQDKGDVAVSTQDIAAYIETEQGESEIERLILERIEREDCPLAQIKEGDVTKFQLKSVAQESQTSVENAIDTELTDEPVPAGGAPYPGATVSRIPIPKPP